MNVSTIVIYDLTDLYEILSELEDFFHLKFKFASNENELQLIVKKLDTYLVISNKNIPKFKNQLTIETLPLKISNLLEKINITILKNSYSTKSNITIGKYKLDLNSREILFDQKILKLTEQEVKMIIYLSKSKNPVSINELQSKIWSYASDLETHTVETHIHRLRKKVFELFKDKDFIKNAKNGYTLI